MVAHQDIVKVAVEEAGRNFGQLVPESIIFRDLGDTVFRRQWIRDGK